MLSVCVGHAAAPTLCEPRARAPFALAVQYGLGLNVAWRAEVLHHPRHEGEHLRGLVTGVRVIKFHFFFTELVARARTIRKVSAHSWVGTREEKELETTRMAILDLV